jgi:hypothetical protein
MEFCLRDGLSFCEVDGRLVFLDIVADRYFCLGRAVENSLRLVIARKKLTPTDEDRLAGLVRHGVLSETNGGGIAPCPPVAPPVSSMLDGASLPAGPIAAATLATLASMARLKCLPLRASLKRARAPITDKEDTDQRNERLARIAQAFDHAGRLVSAHDRCLARSVAVARTAWKAGIDVELVLGVALGPFTAHCWVQRGSIVVNDRIDTVLTYTPILVI